MRLFQKKHKIAEDDYARILSYVEDTTGALTRLGCDIHDAQIDLTNRNLNYIEKDFLELNCLFERFKDIIKEIR